MGKLQFSENLFLGLAELNRFQKFLSDEGFRRHSLINTSDFGIVEKSTFPDLGNIEKSDAFYVKKAGTPFEDVVVNKGIAFDSDANLIINQNLKNITIPNNSIWYWLKISYDVRYTEAGTVSIDAFGNVTGFNTNFTEVMRGQPNYPTKIRFKNSQNGNVDDYEVVKVISDTSCVISGDFNIENNLEYSIVGTFTPGSVPLETNKRIFRYDSVVFTLVPETAFNQEPAHIENKEFFIARVRNNGVDLSLQDKRKKWWRTDAIDYLRDIDRVTNNPLIGVESVKYDIETSPRHQNWINLAFGFRFRSYTIDTSAKKISILIGNGGIYKDTSFFQSGNFNGWRLYSKNGDWKTIIDSQKTGTQIVVTLDVLNPNDYPVLDPEQAGGGFLFIAPPYENIEIKVRRDGAILDTEDVDQDNITNEALPNPLLEQNYNFNINTPLVKIPVPAPDGCYKYNLVYRYKIHNDYTDWKTFPEDTIGYFDEKSFDFNGNLLPEDEDRTLKPYVGHSSEGFIQVCEHPNSFQNFQELIVTGDLFGVNTTALDNAEPVVQLFVGTSKKYQHYKGILNLEANLFIHLNRLKLDNSELREGNEFILDIEQFITLNDFKIRIVEDYVNPTQYTLIKEITSNDVAYIKNNVDAEKRNGMLITCTYDDTGHWICNYDSETTPKGVVRMLKGVAASNFSPTTKEGIGQGFWGWKLIKDMDGLIPKGTSNFTQSGVIDGSNTFTLTAAMIPPHRHKIRGRSSDRNTRGSGYNINQVHLGDYNTSGSGLTYTSYEGGTGGNLQPVTINPKGMKFIFIEKIV